MLIPSLVQWIPTASELSARGYQRYQIQYRPDSPEGFHAWFWAADRPDVEIVTQNEEVCKAIMKYK